MLSIDPHPLLDLRAFITRFPKPLGEIATRPEVIGLLAKDTPAPQSSDDHVRENIRRLLRHGGFKPTGRSKPASEYLLKAAAEGRLSTINVAVDVCNAVSMHSGLPISVVDIELAHEPWRVAVATAGQNYIFNASGQTIDIAGLLCLFDAEGPCANAIKDAQRTKTRPQTRGTLSLIWGSVELPGRVDKAQAWYRELLEQHGATIERLAQ
jgi:DNA/RNA-binding domain of Phe-tRNA-synthetase-like protein